MPVSPNEHLVYHGWDRGEIVDLSLEDSSPDDEHPGMSIVRYSVWVRQQDDDD